MRQIWTGHALRHFKPKALSDYNTGVKLPKRVYRPETADYYLKHSNLMEIRPMVPEFLRKVDVEARPATLADIDYLLDDGWLISIDLNAPCLMI